ncbi:MAG: PAS domain-containing sensor histidine kinase [Candidatus Magnetobacterium sp. LHC-1]|nr:PAS domain S-box protein [Nitrospirota bacterium]
MKGEETKKIVALIMVMAAMVLVVLGASGMLLYQTALREQSQRLLAAAGFRARLIEVLIAHELKETNIRDPQYFSIMEEKNIGKIRSAYEKNSQNLGKTGELVLGRRQGQKIVFLLPLRYSKATSVPFDSNLAEPVRRAIKGDKGTMVGLDYRGEKVLAAYAPIKALGHDYGIVTKIDMSEIRSPFIRVGLVAFFLAVLAILLGAFAFLRITDPIFRKSQESESMFRGLVEQSLAGICIIQHGVFIYVNPRFTEIFGYEKAEELLGKTPLDVVYPVDRELVAENIRKRMDGEIAFAHYCFGGLKKNGDIVQIEVYGSRTEIREIPAIIGLLLDVTKRVEDDKQLRQLKVAQEASRAKNEFLSLVTHELRTPLSGISGLAQTLRDAYRNGWMTQEEDMLGDVLEKILKSAFHMASLIEELLEFSRIEAGRFDIQYEAVSLRQALDIVKSNLFEKIKEKHLDFKVQIPPDLPLIHTGLKQLTQVLFNLIGNAVKFTAERDVITVRAVEEGAMVLVSVEDSGPGMDEETLKHVFDMFWRSDKTMSTEGTGLGLAISKKIVETMGGNIWVKSELGRGNTFYFTLKQWRENEEG